MSLPAPTPTRITFDMFGEVAPLAMAVAGDSWHPARPLGGWLATYGQIGPNGGVIPTQDRQGHVFEAASALGRIDFSDYLRKGTWNDTHIGYTPETVGQTPVIVGVPTGLEFHNELTPLAKAHKKVGFWTEGHLFDRHDPRSWTLHTDYQPTEKDLARADYFWNLATMLKGMARPIGFSAQGKMLLSPCGKRVIWARIDKNAVCEMPQNPDAIAVPLNLAVSMPITRSMMGASPCDSCRCPAGAKCKLVPLALAADSGLAQGGGIKVDENQEQTPTREALDELVKLVAATQKTDERTARRWVVAYFAQKRRSNAEQPPGE